MNKPFLNKEQLIKLLEKKRQEMLEKAQEQIKAIEEARKE